mgnify:FL=1|jgi:hypothetical protein
MKTMTEYSEEHGLPVLVQYFVGPDGPKEMAIFVEDLSEARDFVHMSLRFAVKTSGGDNGAAELFHVHTKQKLGRMAVLFDNAGTQGISHEQWTWVEGSQDAPLH